MWFSWFSCSVWCHFSNLLGSRRSQRFHCLLPSTLHTQKFHFFHETPLQYVWYTDISEAIITVGNNVLGRREKYLLQLHGNYGAWSEIRLVSIENVWWRDFFSKRNLMSYQIYIDAEQIRNNAIHKTLSKHVFGILLSFLCQKRSEFLIFILILQSGDNAYMQRYILKLMSYF